MPDLLRVRFSTSVLVTITVLASGGCSLRSMAVNAIVPTLANPDVYLSEEDPELVREALPFLLKTIESILDAEPKQEQALVFACSGFTLYGNAFLYVDTQIADSQGDYERSAELGSRTWRIFVRARDYCLGSLELKYAGITDGLRQDPMSALEETTAEDVEVLYLLSAAWGLAISNALDQPKLVADLPAVRALLVRALELDEDYDEGALHAALITLEALPPELGGSPERARAHFERAVELSHGLDAGPYVTFAAGVSVPEENRAEFQELLAKALAVDPNEDTSRRLLNLVSQRRARSLLDQIDDLFFDPLEAEEAHP
jgi:predicted anti-sigma-YlaC factor YlaD